MKAAVIAACLALQVVVPARTGSVVGVLRDRDGVLSGVTVTMTRLGPGTQTEIKTDEAGRFEAVLPEGGYELSAKVPGFRDPKARIGILALHTFTANLSLQVGTYSEVINVMPEPGGTALPLAADVPAPPTVGELLQVARTHYEQGHAAEAQAMTARALELMRADRQPSAQSASAGQVTPVRSAGAIVEPRQRINIFPIYPTSALNAGLDGRVVIDALIGTDGFVRNIRILQGAPLFDASVLAAVTRWRYTPATLNGTPIEVALNLQVNFQVR